MEEVPHPGRRTAGYVIGALALAGAGVTTVLLLRRKPSTTPTQPPTTTGSGGGGTSSAPAPYFQFSVANVATVHVGEHATAQVTVHNLGQQAATVTVSGITTYNGQTVGHWDTVTAPQDVQPGASASFTLQTAGPIATNFANDTLDAVFALSNGQVSVTVPFDVLPPLEAPPTTGSGTSTACQSLAVEEQSLISQIRAAQDQLQAMYQAESVPTNTTVTSAMIFAQRDKIASLTAQLDALGAKMQAAGCFGG